MAEADTPGEHAFNVGSELVLYAVCLWGTWHIAALMRGTIWGVVGVLISLALFARAEQCRRETRRAGDFTTGFYIMVPCMCGITMLLRLWLMHR